MLIILKYCNFLFEANYENLCNMDCSGNNNIISVALVAPTIQVPIVTTKLSELVNYE